MSSAGVPSSGGAGAGGWGGRETGTGGDDSLAEPGIALTAPTLVRVRQGGKTKLRVHIERKGGFDGELAVKLAGLPEGVVAEPTSLSGSEEEAEIELAATSEAIQTGHRDLVLRVGGPDGVEEEMNLRLVVAGAPGTLDESFGNGGVLLSDAQNFYAAVAVDESIWIAGKDKDSGLQLYRFGRDGDRRPSIERGGGAWQGLAAHGQSVVARFTTSEEETSFLWRFRLNGDDDTAFADEGLLSLGAGDSQGSVVVAPDGKDLLLVAPDATVVRLQEDGQPARNFEFFGDGESEGAPMALAFDSEGRILASWRGSESRRYAVRRARPEGRLDTSFGEGDGTATSDTGRESSSDLQEVEPHQILVRPDDSLILVATSSPNAQTDDIVGNEVALLSFSSLGQIDEDFGQEGKAAILTEATLYKALRTSGGDIIALFRQGYAPEPQIRRYNDQGERDDDFGEDGQISLVKLLDDDEFSFVPDVVEDETVGRLIVTFAGAKRGYVAAYWL